MRSSDWSSDVCSTDLLESLFAVFPGAGEAQQQAGPVSAGDNDLRLEVADSVVRVVERLGRVALGKNQQVIAEVLPEQLRECATIQRALLPSAQRRGQRPGGALPETGRPCCRERGCRDG